MWRMRAGRRERRYQRPEVLAGQRPLEHARLGAAAISTAVPSAEASRAAASLLAMPPVPPAEPPSARASVASSTPASSGMRTALGSVLGLAVKRPPTLVSRTSRSASRLTATRAERPSLSPNPMLAGDGRALAPV